MGYMTPYLTNKQKNVEFQETERRKYEDISQCKFTVRKEGLLVFCFTVVGKIDTIPVYLEIVGEDSKFTG